MDPILRAEAVAFAYPQENRGLPPVSLSLADGELLHISSPSGGGKSTLARCLVGLIPHLYHGNMEGAVWVGGKRTDQSPLWQITQTAGLVFQNPAAQMLAASVEEEIIFGLENLGLPAAEVDQRLEQALETFGLLELRLRSPLSLSGGEQQKLALAATMARRPRLLVLDEPLSMLDTSAAFDLVKQIASQAQQGAAVIICEHRDEYLADLENLHTLGLDSRLQPPATVLADLAWPGPLQSALRLEGQQIQAQRGGKTILHGWDFNLEGGQLTALVGRNGVGKTTLLRVLAGLQPFTGQVRLQANGHSEPPQLGLVFQNPDLQLFNPTVHEEILYGLAQPDLALYRWLLEALDLQRYAGSSPLLLSEGEKRRLALAMILMRQPRHGILLDEPALGQDSAHKAVLLRLLQALAGAGNIVAYSTHDVELALQADRLILLGPGGILASGAPAELLQRQGAWEQAGLRLPGWVLPPC